MTTPETQSALLRAVGDGAVLRLRVQPGAKRDAIDGVVARGDGLALKVAVTAPPEDGKANDAVLALLAKAWRRPKRSLDIIAGETSRDKTLHIDGEPADVMALLGAWLEKLSAR